jgi:hypothetical protein
MQRSLLCYGIAILMGLILLSAGCTFDEPVNPSWDVQIIIPLSEQRYGLMDLVSSPEEIQSQQYGIGMRENDSLLYFFYQDSIPYSTISDSLYVDPQKDSVNTNLGYAFFDAGVNALVPYTLGEVAPALIPYNGQTIPIPSFSFDDIPKDLAPFANFEYAEIDSGWAHYIVTNNLPVSMDTMNLRLYYTYSPGNVIIDRQLFNIDSGEVVIDSVNMHGMRIVQNLTTAISGASSGSASPVFIETSDSLNIQIIIGRTRVREVNGYLPEQVVTKDTSVALHSSHIVREAKIARGSIFLHSVNETRLHGRIHVQVLNLLSPSGEPFSDSTYMPVENTMNYSAPLDGYTIMMPNPEVQAFDVHAVTYYDSTEQWEHYIYGQRVYTAFNTDTLFLEYIDGVLDTVTVNVGPEEKSVEQIPEGWDQLSLVGASLRVSLNSDIQSELFTNLHLVAQRDGVDRDSILVQENIVPNRDTSFVIHGLERLINSRPDLVVLHGTIATAGDQYLQAQNYFQGNVFVDAPISFTLEPTSINGNITTVADTIDKPVKQAEAEVTTDNHLPLSGRMVVLVTHDSTLFRINPAATDTLIEVGIDAAVYANGRVVEPIYTTNSIGLTDSQIELFRTAPTYLRPVFILDGTHGDTLSAYASDFVGFSAIGKFIYRIDTEK